MGKQKTQAEREIALRVGARIRHLREIQHITQIRLATEIGIRAGPLGWIEKGKHLPSGRVLYRLAKQLNVRLDDLFQETDQWQFPAPEASASGSMLLPPIEMDAVAESVKASHIVCLSVTEKLIELERLNGAVRTSDLPLSVPFAPTETGAEGLAMWVRQKLGIGSVVVSDYLELFESVGLRVVFVDMPDGCSTFSGYDSVNRNAFFFINSRLKKQPEFQVYRLVFELGRIYWHLRKLAGGVKGGAASSSDGVGIGEASFARCFASAFLMPASAMQVALGQLGLTPKSWSLDILLRLKKRYGVSAQSFAQRLQALSLSWCEKQKKSPRYYLFKDELDAFAEKNGSTVEPGGNRPVLSMNGQLGDLILCAEQAVGKDQKPLNAVKRLLRQSGIKLDA